MEGLGAAASAIAVVTLAGQVSKHCYRYSQGVKNAQGDVARLQRQANDLGVLAGHVQQLLNSPRGSALEASHALLRALKSTRFQLEDLKTKLSSTTTHDALRRLHLRDLKWPFKKGEFDQTMQSLDKAMQSISLALQVDQTSTILSIKQIELLDKLPVASGAAFDSYSEQNGPTCLPDTRVDLIANIHKWLNDANGKAIFWLNGMAGTGKSTVSRTIALQLSNSHQLASSFFFKRGEADRNSPSRFITTIARQLASNYIHTALHIADVLESDAGILNRNLPSQFEKLIFQAWGKAQQEPDHGPQALIVDALDECEGDEDIKLLIHLFSRFYSTDSSRLRVFITSRPELPIRLGFKNISGIHQDMALHEIPTHIVVHDISVFLRQKLLQIRTEYNSLVEADRHISADWPSDEKLQTLVNMAVPLFIFAATICRLIGDSRYGSPVTQLHDVLESSSNDGDQLDATYLPVLHRLMGRDRPRRELVERFRTVVGTIVLLEVPLSAPSLSHLLRMRLDTIQALLDQLHSVLSVPHTAAPVRMFHLSFRDFILDSEKRDEHPFWIEEQRKHQEIAEHCLQIMSSCLKQDVCDVGHPGTLRTEYSTRVIETHLPQEVQYACQYWVHHITRCKDISVMSESIYRFLTQCFLFWLEALCIIGEASKISPAIKDLEIISRYQDHDLVDFIRDAIRFVSTNIATIELAPLQIYSSALLFSPSKSIVRKTFENKLPPWISLWPKVESNWDSCLFKLEHPDRVWVVAISYNSEYIASGAGDGVVRIWSMDTGLCTQSYEGHKGAVRALAFSHDSTTLASGSSDDTIRIWCTFSGECLQLLQAHSTVLSVHFSYDSMMMVSSTFKAIHIWHQRGNNNRSKWCCHRTLQCDDASRTSAVFSPDASLIASPLGNTVRLWQSDTGDCVRVLEGHTAEVSSVVFHHDCSVVVSGSRDGTVCLWSTSSWNYLKVLQGDNAPVSTLALSSGTTCLLSVSNRVLRTWDLETGECVQEFHGHGNYVASAALSPSGHRIVSGSFDETVRIWRPAEKNLGQCEDPVGPTSRVHKVILSNDSTLLVAHSDDGSTYVFGQDSAVCLRELTRDGGHNSWRDEIAISHDSSLVAVGYHKNSTVRVWDWENNTLLKDVNFEGDCSIDGFSHDLSLVAVSILGTTKIWDLSSSACLKSFASNAFNSKASVAFSNSLAAIAVVWHEGIVQLWNRETGGILKYNGIKGLRTAVFSNNSSRLALLSPSELYIWQCKTGRIQVINLSSEAPFISALAWSQHDEILTNHGLIKLLGTDTSNEDGPLAPIFASWSGIGVSGDARWLSWDGRRLLRLPVQCNNQAIYTSNPTNSVAIGYQTYEFLVIRLYPEKFKGCI